MILEYSVYYSLQLTVSIMLSWLDTSYGDTDQKLQGSTTTESGN